jgi:hypothetical protein
MYALYGRKYKKIKNQITFNEINKLDTLMVFGIKAGWGNSPPIRRLLMRHI